MRKLSTIILLILFFTSCSIEEIDKNLQEPIKGLDGTNGEQGVQGIQGEQGQNGLSTWYYTNDEGCHVFFQYREINGEEGYQNDEVKQGGESEPICIRDGQDGVNGSDGQDGSDGFNSLIRLDVIESGNVCEHGGKEILSGLDLDRDNYLDDDEVTQTVIWCLNKCPEVCTDVYDTINCRNDKVYVMWIDGIYFYNIDLKFEQFGNQTAKLYGKVNKHNSTKVFLIDVVFSDIVQEQVKDHSCLTPDSSEWVQYATMTGSIKAVDGTVSYTVSRRGEPFQVGVGANSTSSENVLGASGWFLTDEHNQCKGDFNFNLKCI